MQRNGNNGRIKLNPLPLILIVLLVLIDQITKCFFHEKGVGYSVTVINGVLDFTTVYNDGAAFSFLSGWAYAQLFFKILTGVSIVGFYIFFLFASQKEYKMLKYGLVLVFAGMIGNFIDRLAFNYVVDFINLTFVDFAVFNIADICLTVGVIMMVVHFLFLDDDALFRKKKEDGNEKV